MAHTELDLHERRTIEDLLNREVTIREIAEALGRHRSSIYREINRPASRSPSTGGSNSAAGASSSPGLAPRSGSVILRLPGRKGRSKT